MNRRLLLLGAGILVPLISVGAIAYMANKPSLKGAVISPPGTHQGLS